MQGRGKHTVIFFRDYAEILRDYAKNASKSIHDGYHWHSSEVANLQLFEAIVVKPLGQGILSIGRGSKDCSLGLPSFNAELIMMAATKTIKKQMIQKC